MVKVKTKPFGEIEVEEKQIIDFPYGLYGFEYVKKFILLDSNEKSPFKWLQAYDDAELAFVIIRPEDILINYELECLSQDLEDVEASSKDEVIVFAIVTIPEDPSQMTANLQGPVIINPKKRLGKQVISLSDRYSVRHKILDEIKNASKRDK